MDELNQWHSHPDPEDELAHMYRQQEEHAGMQQHFAGRLSGEQHQYYAPPPPRPPNPFLPHPHQSSTSFPGFGVPASLPHLPFGPVAVKSEPGQPSSSSSMFSFGGQPPTTTTLNFSGGDWPADGLVEAVQQQAPERRSRTHWNSQEHVIAERKRREKMQQQFVTLATIVPDLTKTDKISVLGSTIDYVKHLQDKVKTLEEQNGRTTETPTVFQSKCRITDGDASCSGAGAGAFSPSVEATVHGDTIMLKISCRDGTGVLVGILAELEKRGLTITNVSSVVPFMDSCLNVTITASIGERFSTTVDELVTNLSTTLGGFSD